MTKGIQRDLEYIGKYGCYLLCLLNKVNIQDYQVQGYYKTFLKKGWIDKECTVLNPVAIMKFLTGKSYRVEKAIRIDPRADFTIGYFYNEKTGYHHFAEVDKYRGVLFDPLGDSTTVKNGFIESYRSFYL